MLQQLGTERYGEVLADQRAIVWAAFAAYSRTEIATQGDAFFVSLPRASKAVVAGKGKAASRTILENLL